MIVTRSGGLKRAAALVPLALLSAAWTVSISTAGAPDATAGDTPRPLPGGSSVPQEALSVPASVSVPDSSSLGVTGETSSRIVSTSTTSAIPSAALAAYQRAETVINKADAGCHLPWQLIAAIGRVESNHGRANGNVLGADGISRPGVLGKALDGTHGTSLISDTDGGSYDGDSRFDKAVGPMQFIPSTWSTVGVDADGDGQRNPQDIDDAALAAAVYLCSGDDDLSTTAGQKTAVYRYNHSDSYVATVLSVMDSYLAGDFTAAPNDTIPANYFVPDTSSSLPAKPRRHPARPAGAGAAAGAPGSAPGSAPSAAPTTSPSSGTPGGGSGGTPSSPQPTKTPTSTPSAEPVQQIAASLQELATVCTNALTARYDTLSGSNLQQAVTKCVGQLTGKTLPEAQAAVGGVVNGLLGFVTNLLGNVLGGLLGGGR